MSSVCSGSTGVEACGGASGRPAPRSGTLPVPAPPLPLPPPLVMLLTVISLELVLLDVLVVAGGPLPPAGADLTAIGTREGDLERALIGTCVGTLAPPTPTERNGGGAGEYGAGKI